MNFGDVIDAAEQVHELPRGWDIGGGDGLLGKGCDGPLWIPEGNCLAFSDAGHSRRLTWSPSEGVMVLHPDTSKAHGTARDVEGRIVSCEFSTRRVTRMESDGSITVLADQADGSPLVGPDDVVVRSDGSVFFTDVAPPFPVLPAVPSAVCAIDSSGVARRVLTDISKPMGLAFSPDERVLYVTESSTRQLLAYECSDDGVVLAASRRVVIVVGNGPILPHGLAIDEEGNVYVGGPGGIWVVAPSGNLLGVISHPSTATTNLCFGGRDGSALFFTTTAAVGYVQLKVKGAGFDRTLGRRSSPRLADRTAISIERRLERYHDDLAAIFADNVEIEELASGGVFDDLGGGPNLTYARSLEGTVWDHESGFLFFSDIGNDRRLRWSPSDGLSTLHSHTHHTNGATLDNDGATISAEHSARRISRLDRNGHYSVVVAEWKGLQLGRPNDVVVRSDGNIYFTCPWWDFGSGESCQLDYPTFYRVSPSGEVTQGPPGYQVPNGLAFSTDETVLYVNDSLGQHIKAYNVDAAGAVDYASERVFFAFYGEGHGSPDGMKVDQRGNVYCGGPGGLWVIAQSGTALGKLVHGATQVNNLAFGGPDWKTLYFCSWTALFRVPVLTPGVPVPRGRVPSPDSAPRG